VFRLDPLSQENLIGLLRHALAEDQALRAMDFTVDDEALMAMASDARGDARRALTTLEMVAQHARGRTPRIDLATVLEAHTHAPLLYDKSGEEHYNVVSAFIKAMRASDPDAAIYWMMRMLEAGDDPLFVARRMIIFASEDVGNADAQALVVANAADQAFRRIGMPEGIYPLEHAWQRAKAAIEQHGALPVPLALRNPVTALMKAEGYGGGVAEGASCLPEGLVGEKFYGETTED
jgi:putative ATPase